MIALSLAVGLALAQAPASVGATLTLEGALREAQEKNLDLKAAQAKLDQSREIARKVWAAYLPQVSVGASYTRNSAEAKLGLPTSYYIRDVGAPQGPPFDPTQPVSTSNPPGAQTSLIMFPADFLEMTIQKRDQLGAQVSASQALVVPALWPAIRNASLAERATELGVESARREILFAVAQLYYGAAGLKEIVELQQRLLETNVAHEKDAQVRFDVGATPKLALLRAQIDRIRAEEDLRRSENAFASARLALSTLLDRAPDFEVARPEEPPPPPAENLEEKAVVGRPDVQAAKAGLALAESMASGTWYKYLPAIVATAQYRVANVKGFTGEAGSWAVMIGANWTLWDGGLRESELRETAAKEREARFALRAAENRARDEVRRAGLDLESARANRVKAEEQVKLARENRQLVEVNYKSGAATYLDVTDANSALLGAELGAIGEALNSQLSALRLLKAAGLFDPK